MVDILTILAGAFLVATFVIAFEYYKLLRKARREYDQARATIEDIVLSFNRELQHENRRLELVAYRVEGLASKSDGAVNKASEIGSQVEFLRDEIKIIQESKDGTLSILNETGNKLRDLAASQNAVTSRVTNLEEQVKRAVVAPEVNVEAVIPIRRDRALEPLTQTELSALEVLASEGPRTAPEIKNRIRLSREHTARLMKRLYESGYLERDTNKIPFKYSVKKEMERLLKRAESEAQ